MVIARSIHSTIDIIILSNDQDCAREIREKGVFKVTSLLAILRGYIEIEQKQSKIESDQIEDEWKKEIEEFEGHSEKGLESLDDYFFNSHHFRMRKQRVDVKKRIRNKWKKKKEEINQW